MQRIVIIGTLHLGLTPKNELKETLEELKPSQLLVELPEDESARTSATNHADEMRFAMTWAETKKIPVNFFDVDTGGILKNTNTETDPKYQSLVNEQVAEAKAFSWKELNNKTPWKQGRLGEIERKMHSDYFDVNKWEAREEKMLKNIERQIQKDGTVVILTGVGHLDFFESNLSRVELLFRD